MRDTSTHVAHTAAVRPTSTHSYSWGALIAAALSGCAAPDRHQAPPIQSAALPAPPHAPTIERGAAVMIARQEFRHAGAAPRVKIAKANLFSLALVDHSAHFGCPIAAPSCQLFSRLIDGKFTAPVSTQARYSALSAGATHIYATREDRSGIDVIDQAGAATPFVVSGDAMVRPETQIIETSAGLFAWTARSGTLHVSAIEPSPWDGAPRLTGETSYPIALLGGIGGRPLVASTARRAQSHGELAIWAPVIPLPVLAYDGTATDAWMLVATEVRPPPVGTKRTRTVELNGCGSRSRPLSDRSVEKRVHLLTFRRSTWAEDRDVTSLLPPGHGRPTTAVALADGRVDIDGVVIDGTTAEGTAHVAPPLFVPGSQCVRLTDPSFDALAWDAASGEGLVVWHASVDGDLKRRAQRVDASGRALDAPVTIVWDYYYAVIRIGGQWMGLRSTGGTWLTGPNAGRLVTWPWAEFVGAVSEGDSATVFVRDVDRFGVFTLSTSERSPVRWFAQAPNDRHSRHVMVIDGVPSLVLADDDSAVVLRPDGTTRQLRGGPLATQLGRYISLEPTFGGVVLVRPAAGTAEWLLRTGRPEPAPQLLRGDPRRRGAFEVASTPPTLFPSEPGPSVPLPENCSVAVSTGPDAWLAACVVPASDNPDALTTTSLALVPMRLLAE